MKHKLTRFYHSLIMLLFLFLSSFFLPSSVYGALKTSDLESAAWNIVAEHSIIDTKGWLQGICATDQYIVCFVNSSKKKTTPDTLIALYRNSTDANGNPVTPYSYAFHVTEMDYEHGNGMTYNPNTQEIAIAGLFTNNPENAGAVFLIDANTLHFKRKVQVGNGSMNYFGIDYVPEKDQYVLMANRKSDYSFIFTNSNFEILDIVNLKLSYSRSSFQDFIVEGDSIISIPYMQREGYMNIIDVYSISQRKRVGSYYLTLPGHDAFDVEPEGICQLEDGHLLMASAILGTSNFKLYEVHLPIIHAITTAVEYGTITESSSEVLHGDTFTVSYQPNENYRLKSLIVDGTEQSITEYPSEFTFSNIQGDHSIAVTFEEIPRYTITTSVQHGMIDETPSALEHEDLTVNFVPEEHFELTQLLLDGVEVELPEDKGSYTFNDLTSDHTLEAIFSPVPTYTISIQAKHGTVSPSEITVYRGESCTFQATPQKYHTLIKQFVDQKKVNLKETSYGYELTNVQSDHTITLIYQPIGIYLILLSVAFLLLLVLFYFYVFFKRRHARRRRREELQKSRTEAKALLQTLDDIERELNAQNKD